MVGQEGRDVTIYSGSLGQSQMLLWSDKLERSVKWSFWFSSRNGRIFFWALDSRDYSYVSQITEMLTPGR